MASGPENQFLRSEIIFLLLQQNTTHTLQVLTTFVHNSPSLALLAVLEPVAHVLVRRPVMLLALHVAVVGHAAGAAAATLDHQQLTVERRGAVRVVAGVWEGQAVAHGAGKVRHLQKLGRGAHVATHDMSIHAQHTLSCSLKLEMRSSPRHQAVLPSPKGTHLVDEVCWHRPLPAHPQLLLQQLTLGLWLGR